MFKLLHLGCEVIDHGALLRNHQTSLFELLLRGMDLIDVLCVLRVDVLVELIAAKLSFA